MDGYEKIGYSILGTVALLWIVGMIAGAIVCLRFTTSPVMQGAAELLAYGTAVKVRRRSIEI